MRRTGTHLVGGVASDGAQGTLDSSGGLLKSVYCRWLLLRRFTHGVNVALESGGVLVRHLGGVW